MHKPAKDQEKAAAANLAAAAAEMGRVHSKCLGTVQFQIQQHEVKAVYGAVAVEVCRCELRIGKLQRADARIRKQRIIRQCQHAVAAQVAGEDLLGQGVGSFGNLKSHSLFAREVADAPDRDACRAGCGVVGIREQIVCAFFQNVAAAGQCKAGFAGRVGRNLLGNVAERSRGIIANLPRLANML